VTAAAGRWRGSGRDSRVGLSEVIKAGQMVHANSLTRDPTRLEGIDGKSRPGPY